MKKKSLILFIAWAVAAFVLTGIYLALMMNVQNAQLPIICWILFLCTTVLTVSMMVLIRTNAKAEQVTWLAVISKVLLIVYSILGAVGVLIFCLGRLIA